MKYPRFPAVIAYADQLKEHAGHSGIISGKQEFTM
jgi:hypothetical protein